MVIKQLTMFSARIHYRNGQGQCFTNLAFAHSQLGDMKDAEVAFNHALLAAKETGGLLAF